MLHRLLFYLLLMLAPMLLGSNRPLFWSVNGVLSAIILAGFVWSEFGRGRSQSDWRLPFMAISAQAAVGAWIAFQASSWTPKMWHHPIWSISPLLSNSHGAISADPSQTWQTLGWWCTLAIFIVAVRIGTSPRRALFLLKLMVAVCLLVATFGLAAEWFSLNTLGLLQKTHYLGWLTGTFVSRNTAATFIGMGLIIAMALAGREIDRNWIRQRSVFSNFLDLIVGAGGFYTLVAGVLFASLLLTGSRGGTATVVLGGGLLCALKLMK